MPPKLHAVMARRRHGALLRATLWVSITACMALLLYYASVSDVWPLKTGTAVGQAGEGSTAARIRGGGDLRQPLYKPCAKGCTQHGNCNFEEGRCECAWGYGGEDCSVLKLAACRQSTEAWAPVHTGQLPKACECYRQLWALREEAGLLGWDKRMPDRRKSVCFERTGLPPEAQLSHYPEKDEKDVKYFRGVFPAHQEELQRNETDTWEEFARWRLWPLSACPNQCSHRGGCLLQTYDPPEKKPFCKCYFGWQGDDCSQPWTGMYWGQYQCVNNCSDVGTCRNGFCHCPPGRFGIACHRTEAWAPREHRPDPGHLRIYVYELPMTLAHVELLDFGQQHFVNEFFQAFYPLYSAAHQFFRQLLADSEVFTQDPYEASLYYIPAWMLQFTVEFFDPVPHMMKVITYIRQTYPFYNANGGRDHVWFLVRDKGACAEWAPAYETTTGIKIVHWGYRGEAAGGTFGWLGKCFDRRKDVCVTPFYNHAPAQTSEVYTAQALQAAAAVAGQLERQEEVVLPLGNRSTLFFFSGATRDDVTWYSGGVRQKLVKLHRNATGFLFKIGHHSFEEQMRNSMFCLAPSGLGWGIRLPQGTAAGCIPVIIQDGIDQYHDDILDYGRFAVRVAQKDIPILPQILADISTGERAKLQQGLVELHRALMWGPAPFDEARVRPERRGLAYNYTIASLRRSYSNFVIERTLVSHTAVVQPLDWRRA